jgi:hypothetical protein
MSTKIYHAWRVNVMRLNGFIDSYHDHAWSTALDHIVEAMGYVTEAQVGVLPEWNDTERVGLFETRRKFDRVMDACEYLAKHSGERSFLGLDIEAGINIWVRGRYAYCVPADDMFLTQDWTPPKYARDFSYWNNSDRPTGVDADDWWKRKSVWSKLCLGQELSKQSWDARRTYHAVIDLQARNAQMLRERLWTSVAAKLGINPDMLDTTYSERIKKSREFMEQIKPAYLTT